MSKGLKILIGVLIILVIVCGIIFFIKPKENVDEEQEDTVVITDGKIENEKLIDEFINDSLKDTQNTLKIIEKNGENETNIQITFVPKEEITTQENEIVNIIAHIPETDEEYKKEYGYYIFSINGEEKARYDALRWEIKRATKDGRVTLHFYTISDVTEYPQICEYDIESSNYGQKFKITYNQRKDLGIKTIIDKNTSDKYDYSICTFGGDVTITIDEDEVYLLEDALIQNIISGEDILEQAKTDEKYGLCERGYYLDGGSTEYCYSDYTILKCDTLDGNKNLYIGMKGQILSQINRIESSIGDYELSF